MTHLGHDFVPAFQWPRFAFQSMCVRAQKSGEEIPANRSQDANHRYIPIRRVTLCTHKSMTAGECEQRADCPSVLAISLYTPLDLRKLTNFACFGIHDYDSPTFEFVCSRLVAQFYATQPCVRSFALAILALSGLLTAPPPPPPSPKGTIVSCVLLTQDGNSYPHLIPSTESLNSLV